LGEPLKRNVRLLSSSRLKINGQTAAQRHDPGFSDHPVDCDGNSRGAFFGVTVFLINKLFGGSVISWYILCFGIPSHVVADFAGFSNITLDSNQKPAVLGTCYLVLVVLALVCGFSLGLWAGLLVFIEAWLLGVPGGARRTVRDLDAIQLAQDLDRKGE
jgi:hypothetical protein